MISLPIKESSVYDYRVHSAARAIMPLILVNEIYEYSSVRG